MIITLIGAVWYFIIALGFILYFCGNPRVVMSYSIEVMEGKMFNISEFISANIAALALYFGEGDLMFYLMLVHYMSSASLYFYTRAKL